MQVNRYGELLRRSPELPIRSTFVVFTVVMIIHQSAFEPQFHHTASQLHRRVARLSHRQHREPRKPRRMLLDRRVQVIVGLLAVAERPCAETGSVGDDLDGDAVFVHGGQAGGGEVCETVDDVGEVLELLAVTELAEFGRWDVGGEEVLFESY